MRNDAIEALLDKMVPYLEQYRRASRELEAALALEETEGRPPHPDTYHRRDDSGVELADWCMELVQLLDQSVQPGQFTYTNNGARATIVVRESETGIDIEVEGGPRVDLEYRRTSP